MMSPRPISEDRVSPPHFRHTPLQVIHIVGNFLRIWSMYSLYRYLSQTGASVVLFLFTCLVPASILFLILQKPWKGRPLSNTQVVPSLINGGITALYFILWGKGLKSCGPLRAILAEYSGAILGVLSAVLYGRKGHAWKKVGGLIAMVASFYFLSQGTGVRYERDGSSNLCRNLICIEEGDCKACFTEESTKKATSCYNYCLCNMLHVSYCHVGRNHRITFNIAEERLHMVFSSPKHLMVAGGCIIVMEIVYKMDFSLPGFLICCIVLGFGIYEATSLERGRKDSFQKPDDPSNGLLGDEIQMSALPT
ncbi:hypothetical protein M0R45_034586 [Rubus argutus]|uniref:Uncharacterized protein n=1 Tax=Rubus argutus TaxID=59490 RepID=A0AAW1VVZ0_RUBAR